MLLAYAKLTRHAETIADYILFQTQTYQDHRPAGAGDGEHFPEYYIIMEMSYKIIK
jgi:hypothetical protein